MIETIQADWIKSEAINLENCCNDNPLKILGPHFYEEQWVIRVWTVSYTHLTLPTKRIV